MTGNLKASKTGCEGYVDSGQMTMDSEGETEEGRLGDARGRGCPELGPEGEAGSLFET